MKSKGGLGRLISFLCGFVWELLLVTQIVTQALADTQSGSGVV